MNTTKEVKHDVSALISRLFVYPVKSCAGVEVAEALLTDTGLELDRAWMVVDEQGVFMTQREHPRLSLVHPHIKENSLVLNAAGMQALEISYTVSGNQLITKIWEDDVPGFDMGEEAAQWFTDFLSVSTTQLAHKYRLVRFDPSYRRASSMKWTKGLQAFNQFSDGFPLLVLSEASHEYLNERLMEAGHAGVSIERFRPNIVLSGLQAHDEDQLGVLTVYTNPEEIMLKPVKPCPRCPIPNINPLNAEISVEVGDTLQSYRQDPRLDGAITFGMNLIVLQGIGATLRVGQQVLADFDFS